MNRIRTSSQSCPITAIWVPCLGSTAFGDEADAESYCLTAVPVSLSGLARDRPYSETCYRSFNGI
jgi:hypothetical protein